MNFLDTTHTRYRYWRLKLDIDMAHYRSEAEKRALSLRLLRGMFQIRVSELKQPRVVDLGFIGAVGQLDGVVLEHLADLYAWQDNCDLHRRQYDFMEVVEMLAELDPAFGQGWLDIKQSATSFEEALAKLDAFMGYTQA